MNKCSETCVWKAHGLPEVCKEKCVIDKYREERKDKSLYKPLAFSECHIILKTRDHKDTKL